LHVSSDTEPGGRTLSGPIVVEFRQQTGTP